MACCSRCLSITAETIKLSEHVGSQELCKRCFNELVPKIEKNQQKSKNKEAKIVRKFMKYRYDDLGCFYYLIFFFILIVIISLWVTYST